MITVDDTRSSHKVRHTRLALGAMGAVVAITIQAGCGSTPDAAGRSASAATASPPYVFMSNADACDNNLNVPCGWTPSDEGQGYTCHAESWGTGCEPGTALSPTGTPGNTAPSSYVYMSNTDACDNNLNAPCGWTPSDEGQGYTCHAESWGTGCEPGTALSPTGTPGNTPASSYVYMSNTDACDNNLDAPCGWTPGDEGQGYTCQAESWGTGCEPK